MDLAQSFATRSSWKLTATQGPPDESIDGGEEDGAIQICLTNDRGRACDPAVATMLAMTKPDDFGTPHYLETARIVRPLGLEGPPILLLATASMHSGDGDQRHGTLVLAYDRAADRFRTIFRARTNRNNNQEIRYVDSGPLAGAIIVAEPTRTAPFGYWITVSRSGSDLTYRQVLHYRSATRYDDGNPLPVIDSDMPTLQRQLGLWRPGTKPPLPAMVCAAPRVIADELWCGPKT